MGKEITSPLKAIKQFCLDCCGGDRNWQKNCDSKICPLVPFRMGKNPFTTRGKREYTEEEKEAMRERMKKAREAR